MLEMELLYFDGCPSWHRAWNDLGTLLAETGVDAAVRLRDVLTMEEHERVGFAGSPTIRIEGVDLEGYAGPGVIACRRYAENDGLGWPSGALLRARLTEAAGAAP
jgi:hypothetical protein